MPTPSGNAPDPNPHSPRGYAFSSCPEPDEMQLLLLQQQRQQQSPESPTSPASPSSPSSQNPRDPQAPQPSWRQVTVAPPPESQYEPPPRSPANVSAANPRPVAVSPMPSSVAAALADGSGDFESSGEQRRGIGVGVLEPMEMDHDDDGQKDEDEDDDEDMELGTSSNQGHTADGNDEGSDSEISEQGIPLVLEPPHVADLQDHLMGLIRRIDELNARDAARGGDRAARPPEGTTGPIRPTIRSRQPGVLNLWDPADDTPSPATSPGREDSASPGREAAGGSSTRDDDEADAAAWGGADTSMLGMGYEYADPRVAPISPSTYLRPGSRFHGTQQSERQRYDVQVEIKHVDLRESFLCGYLRIQGWFPPLSLQCSVYKVPN